MLFNPIVALAQDATIQEALDATQAKINDAVNRVIVVVNQPITHYTLEPARAKTYAHGWFENNVIKPDFNTVDIRQTQTFPYPKYYVTSNLNPAEMFAASELEYNPMTQYFYTDRTLPKKRLTEIEMLQINQLYRIIGNGEQRISEIKNLVIHPAVQPGGKTP